MVATRAGISYETLIGSILQSAFARRGGKSDVAWTVC
jgi:hypothetical protein